MYFEDMFNVKENNNNFKNIATKSDLNDLNKLNVQGGKI
tara:strand:+ start:64 stop:180 length:117 start_codon:yes stop_codon:yes gene_type:complete